MFKLCPSQRRLSHQICRVVAIMEVLHLEERGACTATIHEVVNSLLPRPVCERTIRRDLDSLVAMGFAEVETEPNQRNKPARRYHLACPVLLRHRLLVLGRDGK